MANVLTKERAEQAVVFDYLRDGQLLLVQTAKNEKIKERQRAQRAARKKAVKEAKESSSSLKKENGSVVITRVRRLELLFHIAIAASLS